ncbi:MAM and LDL-receptor class A domain-containing protein 1-like isoform X2 [Acanthaster planci]|uniref:MAM and LDL-receptor class A domain-containing protein 1-like isoform X2 n=1 Tax=Acanthaster planci TaxID=133434 RepID=A0A8B7Y8U1_ACAPL|nr:MAM and LDL-receptor class A domain-containing protein 1-like isoform X2 [Acanthaster planci]
MPSSEVLVVAVYLLAGVTLDKSQDFNCTFESSSLCGWTQSTLDDYNLDLGVGKSPSSETGPLFDHTFGDESGAYVYLESSRKAGGSRAVLLSPPVQRSHERSRWCFSFWYNMFGSQIGSLRVFAYSTQTGHNLTTKLPMFSLSGQQTGQRTWVQASVDISNRASIFTVALEFIDKDGHRGDIAIDDVELQQDSCPDVLSFDCSFDDGPCGWIQSVDDDYNWVLERGHTSSRHTGPEFDHTTNDLMGLYYYAEATEYSAGDKAVLLSPVVTVRLSQQDIWCFSLWYNMYGQEIDSLRAYAYPSSEVYAFSTREPVIVISGQHTGRRVWLQAKIEIRNQSTDFTIAIEAIRGSGHASDIAFDDVTIFQGECPRDTSVGFDCDFEGGYCGWIQFSDDGANWALERGDTYSANTGPEYDHTFGAPNGTYLFLEADQAEELRAVIISPVVTNKFSYNRSLSFWYNMFGSGSGTLNVYRTAVGGNISEGILIFSRDGQQTDGTTWLKAKIALSNLSSEFRIAFEASANSFRSDIAIDDVSISADEDIEAPDVSCPSNIGFLSTDSGVATAVVSWSPLPSVTDNVDVLCYSNITCADEVGNIVRSGGVYGLGTTTVTCRVSDSSSNEGYCQFEIIVVDSEAPNITCPTSVLSIGTDIGVPHAAVFWSPMPSAVDNVDVFDGSDITCQNGAGNVAVSGALYELGTTRVTCHVTDSASNRQTCRFTIIVVDKEPPHVTCPTSVTSVSTGSGNATAIVSWPSLPTVTDNVDLLDSSEIICQDDAGNDVVSGGIYGVGTTVVTCRVKDSALNEGLCQFAIVVEDLVNHSASSSDSATFIAIGVAGAVLVFGSISCMVVKYNRRARAGGTQHTPWPEFADREQCRSDRTLDTNFSFMVSGSLSLQDMRLPRQPVAKDFDF